MNDWTIIIFRFDPLSLCSEEVHQSGIEMSQLIVQDLSFISSHRHGNKYFSLIIEIHGGSRSSLVS